MLTESLGITTDGKKESKYQINFEFLVSNQKKNESLLNTIPGRQFVFVFPETRRFEFESQVPFSNIG